LNGEVLYRLEQSLTSSGRKPADIIRSREKIRQKLGISTTVPEIVAARDEGRR
jgi:hypothetical protein